MGATSVLGHVVAGWTEASELDKRRQFDAEMDRRRQIGDFLTKLAGDETARPESRKAAAQELFNLTNTPHDKAYKLKIEQLLAPYVPKQTISTLTPPEAPPTVPTPQTVTPIAQAAGEGLGGPAALASATHPPMLAPPEPPPPGIQVTGGPSADLAAQIAQGGGRSPVSLVKPEQPAGIWMPPEQIAQERAQALGMATQAQMEAQINARMKVFIDIQGSLIKQGVDPKEAAREATVQSALALGHPLPYSATKPSARAAAKIFDPTDPKKQTVMNVIPIFDPAEGTIHYMSDRGEITDPEFVPPGWTVPKETKRSTTTPGGLTTTTTSTTGPKLAAPGAPPSGAVAKPKKAAAMPAAVEAAIAQIGMYGLPIGKMSDAQALGIKWMKEHGIDPSVTSSTQGRSRADAGRAMQPLLQRAQELISQANPQVVAQLGPLAGRWADIEKRLGSLDPDVRELAGTLMSVYSFAVTMHGWRSAEAPKQFAATYGELEATPESLAGGLRAMQATADAVVNIGYPGLTQQGSGQKRAYEKDGKWYDATTHEEITGK